MIVSLNNSENIKTFMIMPNRAMPWRQQVFIFSVIAAFSLGIAVGFYMQGLTLILPFAGIELAALAAALYISAWRGGRKEVVSITADQVYVESGFDAPESRIEFDKTWLQVVLLKPRFHWYPSRLMLRSHGRQMEVGCFLNEEERKGLAITLRHAIES